MRYVVLAALVVLVGGYVVGQPVEPRRPIESEPTAQASEPWIGLIDPDTHPPLVGRYAPAADGRMLDTVNGTLYEAHARGWKVVASLFSTVATADSMQRVALEAANPQKRLSVYEKLSRDREEAFRDVERLVRKLREQPGSEEEVRQQLEMNQLIVVTLDDLLDSAMAKKHLPPEAD